ncbi:MAG: hypothetical protein ABFS12_11910 [Bacteroidota bacterium]
MIKIKYMFFTIVVISIFSTLSIAQIINIGEAELIYTDDEIPIRYDGSMSTVKIDGEMHFFHSFGCRFKPGESRRSRHSWHKGTPLDPLKTHVSSKTEEEMWDYNGWYKNAGAEGTWILGIYEAENGELLGITHSEVTAAAEKQGDYEMTYVIGLGYSIDKGQTWKYCGEIAKASNPNTNVGGGAYIIKDNYMYVYFNDSDTDEPEPRRPVVIRAKLKDVLKDGANGKVGKWFKYKDGKWNTPGLSDIPGDAIFALENGREDLHADAAYCTALGKYLLTVQTHEFKELLLYSSEDGLSWKKEGVVDVAGEMEMQPYSTFVDFDGPSNDCHTVDDNFYIYFPRKKMKNHDHDYMYRSHITIK